MPRNPRRPDSRRVIEMNDIKAVVAALYDSAEMLRRSIPGATGEQHDAWVMRSIAAREAIVRIERVLEAAKELDVSYRANADALRHQMSQCPGILADIKALSRAMARADVARTDHDGVVHRLNPGEDQ